MSKRVDEKIEKYLGEASKKEAAKKLEKVIKSINSADQVETAVNMIVQYAKKYGPRFYAVMPELDIGREIGKWKDVLQDRLERMNHEGKISDEVMEDLNKKFGID